MKIKITSLIFSFLIGFFAFSADINRISIDSLSELIRTSSDANKIITYRLTLAEQVLDSDRELAFNNIDESIKLAIQSGDRFQLAKSYGFMGRYLEKVEDFSGALNNYFLSEHLFGLIGNPLNQTKILGFIGELYCKLGVHYDALSVFNQVLNIYKDLKNSPGVANVYNRIGKIYAELNEFDLAREYFETSLEMFGSLESDSMCAQCNSNLGLLCIAESKYKKSVSYLRASIGFYEQSGAVNKLGEAYTNMAIAFMRLNVIDSAQLYFDKALIINKDLNNEANEVFTNVALAEFYNIQSAFEKGLIQGKYALAKAESIGSIEAQKLALFNMYQSSIGLDDHETGLRYFQNYTSLKDSINAKNESNQFHKTDLNNNRESRIEAVQGLLPKTNTSLSKTFWRADWFLYSLFFISIIGLISYNEFRKKKSKGELSDESIQINYLRSTRFQFILAASLYLLFPMFRPQVTVEFYDPTINRILICGLITIVFFLSFWSNYVRSKVGIITKILYIILIFHTFYLLYMNNLCVEIFIELIVLLSAATAVFKRMIELFFMSVLVIVLTIIICAKIDVYNFNPSLLLATVIAIMIVALLVSFTKMDLNQHLEFSNEVVNHADALVFIVNRKGENIYTSQSVKFMLGFEPHELREFNWVERLGYTKDQAGKITNELILIAIGAIEPVDNSYQLFKGKHGKMMWLSIKEKRLSNNRVLIIGLDVTEHKKIQDELAQSERNFRQINETLSDVFYLYNLEEYKYEYISPNSAEIIGPPPQFFYDKQNYIETFVIAEDQNIVREAFEQIRMGIPFDIEYRIRIGERIKWIREKSYPVFNDDQVSTKNSGICQDITDQKNAEIEIQRLSLIASNTDNFILIVNKDNRVEWANNSFYKVSGYKAHETLGRLPLHLISGPLTSEITIDEISKSIFEDHVQMQCELVNYRKDGSVFYSSIEVTPVLDEFGNFDKYFVIGSDISERKMFEEEIQKANLDLIAKEKLLHESEQNLRELIRSVKEVFMLFESDGGAPIFISDSYQEVFGISTELEQDFKHWMSTIHPLDKNRVMLAYENRLSNKEFNEDFRIILPTGEEKWVNSRIFSINDDEGNEIKISGFIEDITLKKEQEIQISKIADQLDIIHSIEKTILQAESTEAIIYNTLEQTIDKLPIIRASVVLFDTENQTYVSFGRHYDDIVDLTDKKEFPINNFFYYDELVEKRVNIIDDLRLRKKLSENDKILVNQGVGRILMSPLFYGDTLLGSLNVCFKEDYDEDEDHFIEVTNEVANGVAIAIQQSQLRDNLKHSNIAINASIEYAKMIQQAYIPTSLTNDSHFKEHFIINRPKDIVSGDFYWTGQFGDTKVIALGDCTGHGVPGAFMTIIGIGELNNLVNQQGIIDPASILKELDVAIVSALLSNSSVQLRDGMDIGIFTFNEVTNEVCFAGARRPLYQISADGLITHLGTKRSLGDDSEQFGLKFESKIISWAEGDSFYLFSDGITDQFGGDRHRKLSKRVLDQKLIAIQDVAIADQKPILEKMIDDWKGKIYQVDDMLMIGFKIK